MTGNLLPTATNQATQFTYWRSSASVVSFAQSYMYIIYNLVANQLQLMRLLSAAISAVNEEP